MKKDSYFIFVVLFLVSCAPTKTLTKIDDSTVDRNYNIASFIGPKKKIAVAKFGNTTRFGQRRLGDNITSVLNTELVKSSRFLLLEREQIDKIMEQVKLSQTGITQGTLDQIQLIDTDFLITGDVTHYSVSTVGKSDVFSKSKIQIAEVAVDVRVINARTGEILLSETGRGKAEKKFSQVLGMGSEGGYDESLEMDAFRTSVIKLVENIVATLDNYPWCCDIIKINGDKLYIDAGKKSNLKIGDQLAIYKKGEPLKDFSGRILGYEEQFIGYATVNDYFGEEAATVSMQNKYDNLALPLIGKITTK